MGYEGYLVGTLYITNLKLITHLKLNMKKMLSVLIQVLCPLVMVQAKVFYPAKARLLRGSKQIKVYMCPETTHFNCFGIPVTPFRSDDWE